MRKKASPLKIKAGLFCEDIRTEKSGKLILIGIYASNIQVASLPATLLLCGVVIGEAVNSGEVDMEFRVLLGDRELVSGKGHVRLDARGPVLLPVPNLLLRDIDSEGTLTLQARMNGDWQNVCSIAFLKS
jgi:hypothetical protein